MEPDQASGLVLSSMQRLDNHDKQVKGYCYYYLQGYRDKFGYIITQTPLQSTAVDCCRLIHEQDIKVIVTFQEYDKKDVRLSHTFSYFCLFMSYHQHLGITMEIRV